MGRGEARLGVGSHGPMAARPSPSAPIPSATPPQPAPAPTCCFFTLSSPRCRMNSRRRSRSSAGGRVGR